MQTTRKTTDPRLGRISGGLYGGNLNGHLVLAAGHRGAWVISVDGEILEGPENGHFPTIAEASHAAAKVADQAPGPHLIRSA